MQAAFRRWKKKHLQHQQSTDLQNPQRLSPSSSSSPSSPSSFSTKSKTNINTNTMIKHAQPLSLLSQGPSILRPRRFPYAAAVPAKPLITAAEAAALRLPEDDKWPSFFSDHNRVTTAVKLPAFKQPRQKRTRRDASRPLLRLSRVDSSGPSSTSPSSSSSPPAMFFDSFSGIHDMDLVHSPKDEEGHTGRLYDDSGEFEDGSMSETESDEVLSRSRFPDEESFLRDHEIEDCASDTLEKRAAIYSPLDSLVYSSIESRSSPDENDENASTRGCFFEDHNLLDLETQSQRSIIDPPLVHYPENDQERSEMEHRSSKEKEEEKKVQEQCSISSLLASAPSSSRRSSAQMHQKKVMELWRLMDDQSVSMVSLSFSEQHTDKGLATLDLASTKIDAAWSQERSHNVLQKVTALLFPSRS